MQKNPFDQATGAAPIRYTRSGAVDTEHTMRHARRLRVEFSIGAVQCLKRFITNFLAAGAFRRASAPAPEQQPCRTRSWSDCHD